MSLIEIEKGENIYTLEYDRKAIIAMEDMGFNIFKPEEKFYTNFEIMIRGGLLKHHPHLSNAEQLEIIETCKNDYGMRPMYEELGDMISEVFTIEGKKKIVRKGKK